MAEGGDIKKTFSKFATKAEKKEATSKDITKWCTDAGVLGKNCNSNHLDIAFTKCKTKGKPNVNADQLDTLCDELAKMYMKDKKIADQKEAKTQLMEKMACAEPKGHGTTGTSKTGGVKKMTDTSKYTGAHKERFDKDGKGKGAEGRSEKVENTGYTGDYKGKDTFDQKK